MIERVPQEELLERLAARILSGEAAAEEEFARIFQPRVRTFVAIRTGDPDLAEDLAQEVLLAVLCALREGRLQNTAALPAFVLGTARNMLNGQLRARAREKTGQIVVEVEIPRPAREQHEFERNHAARQAIATLEPHERAVLLLTLVDGLGPEEVAERLGVSCEVVRQRKSRALKRIAQILQLPSQTGELGPLRKEGMR